MTGPILHDNAASLTRRMALAAARPVDAVARRRAVLHWLDWIGCVAAGARSPVGVVVRDWERVPGGPRPVESLLGSAQDAWHALLQDAAPANVEEMDDMHRQAILHPGPVVLPALASLARSHGLSAAQVLDGAVRGYEAMIRVGRAVGPRHYHFWHNTATAGAFGAAAGAASALGLDPERVVWALGNAGTQAAGLWQVRLEPVMSKQLHTAHAAWAGLTAASLAQAGFTGPQFILEGPRGFFAALCDGDGDGKGADAGAVVREEADWLIHETSFKPWPACRHTHAAIDCVLAIRDAEGGGPLDFTSARVEAFDDALTICDNPRPGTRTQAKFSLQYAVAAAASLGPLQPAHFDASFFASAALQDACTRVQLAPSPTHQADYPAHFGARVALRLADGRSVSHSVRDSMGDPERAMSAEAIFGKAAALMDYGGVDPGRSAAAVAAARALIGGDDAAMLRPLPQALLAPLFGRSPVPKTAH